MFKKLILLGTSFLSISPLMAMEPEAYNPTDSKNPWTHKGYRDIKTSDESEEDLLPQLKHPEYQPLLLLAYGYLDFCQSDLDDFNVSNHKDNKQRKNISGTTT